MPAVSDKQRKLMALAREHPEKVSSKNKAVTKMSKEQLSDFMVKKAASKVQQVRSQGKSSTY